MPEATLHSFANHREFGVVMSADGGSGEKVIVEFGAADILVEGLCAEQARGVSPSTWNCSLEMLRITFKLSPSRWLFGVDGEVTQVE
jgi:hypothetical protein